MDEQAEKILRIDPSVFVDPATTALRFIQVAETIGSRADADEAIRHARVAMQKLDSLRREGMIDLMTEMRVNAVIFEVTRRINAFELDSANSAEG